MEDSLPSENLLSGSSPTSPPSLLLSALHSSYFSSTLPFIQTSAAPLQIDFRAECLSESTERLLCENTAMEVIFACAFPRNASAVNAPETFSSAEITQLIATGIAFAVSLTGNLLVVCAAPFDANLRTPINLFLVNLSLADILVSVVCLWDNALRSLSYNYMLGPVGCKGGGFVHMTCLFVSVLTLAGIAVDRVYAVLLPLQARHTPPRPKWVISVIWALSIAAAAPFFALREYRVYKWNDFTETQCTYSRGSGVYTPETFPPCEPGTNYVNMYHMMVTVTMFFIPVIVILLAYALIILKLWKSSALIEDSRIISRVHISAKKKVVRLALIVLTAFLVCWSPLQVLILMSVFGNNQHSALSSDRHLFWIYFLAYMNSAINPIIYGGFSRNYRTSLLRVIRKENQRKSSTLTGRSRGGTVTITLPAKSENLVMRHHRQNLGTTLPVPSTPTLTHQPYRSPPSSRNNKPDASKQLYDEIVAAQRAEVEHICSGDVKKPSRAFKRKFNCFKRQQDVTFKPTNPTDSEISCQSLYQDKGSEVETAFISQKEIPGPEACIDKSKTDNYCQFNSGKSIVKEQQSRTNGFL